MASRVTQIDTDPLRQLLNRVARLESEVREMRAGRRLEAASVGQGGITIKDGGALRVVDADGNLIGLVGDLGDGQRGFILQRAGGHPALSVYGTGAGSDYGFVGLYDVSGNYIVTDDAESRRGLARPYIPLAINGVDTPTSTTTSASFADLASGTNPVQHPVMYADLLVRASDATTAGEVRVAIDGTGVGPTISIPAGQYSYRGIGPFRVSVSEPAYGALHNVSVQARRTAGAGNIGLRVLSLLGLESSFAP